MATPERASGLLASRLLLVGSARVVVAGSGLGFSLVAARVLGPGATGTLYVAISLVVGISLFARMGNDINLIWQANRAQEQLSGPALGRLLVASMAIGCALCVAIGAALKAGASQGVYPGITRA
ncbi:MAG TPA: hypothetical protein VJ947_07775, partial [Pseudohaliea sp.]|nr:hypothetical protein [Pseudohaliea sp.]